MGASALPYERIVPWIFGRVRFIDAKLDKPVGTVHTPKLPYWLLMGQALNFAKGYLPLWLADEIFFSDNLTLFLVAVILVTHLWGWWGDDKNPYSVGMVIWGIYSYLFTPLIFLYPVLVLLSAVVLNSVYAGFIGSILVVFYIFYSSVSDLVYLPINAIILGITIIRFYWELQDYVKGNRRPLLMSFRQRIKPEDNPFN
ncbi:hypothetical protein HOH87_04650 [bacterium]|jgi:hypothetical protein|nr:hypothetical protein [bacterium]